MHEFLCEFLLDDAGDGAEEILGRLGPGESGPGQLGPGQLGPGEMLEPNCQD